jgi:hypothetical protein
MSKTSAPCWCSPAPKAQAHAHTARLRQSEGEVVALVFIYKRREQDEIKEVPAGDRYQCLI